MRTSCTSRGLYILPFRLPPPQPATQGPVPKKTQRSPRPALLLIIVSKLCVLYRDKNTAHSLPLTAGAGVTTTPGIYTD